MNKIKATKKEMRENYRILSVGYCNMQYLLNFEKPIAYSAGVYGWACDYYNINGIVISTGYQPINSKNMKDDYKLIREYEKMASSIDYGTPHDERKEKTNQLLIELLEKLKG